MKITHILSLIACTLLLSACGGGGADSADGGSESAASSEPSALQRSLKQAADSFVDSFQEEVPALKQSVERIVTQVVQEQDIPAVQELQKVAKMDVFSQENFASYQAFAGEVGASVLPRNFSDATGELQTMVTNVVSAMQKEDLKQIATNFQNILRGDFNLSDDQKTMINGMLQSYAPMLGDIDGLMDSARGVMDRFGN